MRDVITIHAWLEEVALANGAVTDAEDHLQETQRRARAAGATWAQIGAVMKGDHPTDVLPAPQ